MLSIKYVSLLVLAIQNSALILVMRYSRTISGPKYIASTAVLLSEITKTTLSFIILLFTRWRARSDPKTTVSTPLEQQDSRSILRQCFDEIFQISALIPVLVPAILYTVQNNLQYLAASNLDAATFQVLYQGKVLTTALFAILILRQRLTAVKWAAIFILTVGLILISYPSSSTPKVSQRDASADNRAVGLFAVLAACTLSGFTGVLLEFILKKANKSGSSSGNSQLWVRNVQLGMASVVVAVLAAGVVDGRQILENGFFYGYNSVVCLTFMLQAVGGLIVAIVITYADNILKGFATSLSLVASTAISAMAGDVVLTERFIVGVVLVLAATNVYGLSLGKQTKDDEAAIPVAEQDLESQPVYVEVAEKNSEGDPEDLFDDDMDRSHHGSVMKTENQRDISLQPQTDKRSMT